MVGASNHLARGRVSRFRARASPTGRSLSIPEEFQEGSFVQFNGSATRQLFRRGQAPPPLRDRSVPDRSRPREKISACPSVRPSVHPLSLRVFPGASPSDYPKGRVTLTSRTRFSRCIDLAEPLGYVNLFSTQITAGEKINFALQSINRWNPQKTQDTHTTLTLSLCLSLRDACRLFIFY